MGDDKQQKLLLSSLILNKPVNRRQILSNDKRKTSREFVLCNSSGEKNRVCLKFFCATFSISHRVVEICMKKVSKTGVYVGHDGRSEINLKRYNSTSDDIKNHVKMHIDSFPRVESHYCRKDTKKQYLAPDLNLSLMYRLYRDEYCKNNNIHPVSDFVYRSVFHDYDPSLSFFIPKKDQCTKCNSYQMAPNKSALQEEWEMHKLRENQAMNMKAEDKKKAIENKGLHFRSVTFDLQAILSIPFASDSQIYYKRKLNVYNFTIMDASKNDGFCFVWDETNGKKGSNEIGSCLLKYIFFNLPDSVTHLTAFSDTCGGQNRNQFVCTALLFAVNKKTNLDLIDLKFMESGHSYLECDSMHATIERKSKHKNIYTTREWALLISTARLNPRPYQVNVMSYNDFYDLKDLVGRTVKNVSTTVTNQKVNWIKIKWIRVEKSKPQIIQFKYNLDDSQFLEIDIALDKKTRLQHKDPFDWSTIVPKQLYEKKLLISAEKKKDLMSLLNKKVIPEEYSHFFEEIPTTKKNISNRVSDGDYDDE